MATRVAARLGLPGTAGSDAHQVDEVGKWTTDFEREIENEQQLRRRAPGRPLQRAARFEESLNDRSQLPTLPPFRFYGAERSYFTGKARPALRAKRVYFEEILPTAEAYREILRRTGMIFIPVVVTPEDETWQDTSDIIDALEARFPEPALIPATPVQRIVSYLFELYADEFMLLPAMHYRWSAPESEKDARGAFAALSGDRETANRFADQMAGSLPVLGVVEATIPAIEAHLGELLGHMESDPLRSELPARRADVAGRLRDDGALLRSPLPRSRSRPDPARARRAREPLGRAHESPEPGGLHGLPAGRRRSTSRCAPSSS